MYTNVILSIAFLGLASPSIAAIPSRHFVLDCTHCPDSCNNDCYSAFVSDGNKGPLVYDKPSNTTVMKRRNAGGCKTSRSPCGVNGIKRYSKSGNSCDEFPYASTEQGGAGATLRCVDLNDNSNEGRQLGRFFNKGKAKGGCAKAKCKFEINMIKGTFSKAPYCVNKGGKNDGFEFKYKNKKYKDAKRRRMALTEDDWDEDDFEPHVPNEAHFFPPHLRREFLLSDGKIVLSLTTDLNKSYENAVFSTPEGTATVVRELFGDEKSEEFRPLPLNG